MRNLFLQIRIRFRCVCLGAFRIAQNIQQVSNSDNIGGNASADFSGRGFSLSSEVMMRYWTVFNTLRASGSMMSISSFYKKVCVVQWDKVVGI